MRFEVVIDSNNDKSIWDYKTEEPLIALIVSDSHRGIYGIDECCNLLNELVEKNEQLKSTIDEICTEIEEKPTITKTEILVKLMNMLNKVD